LGVGGVPSSHELLGRLSLFHASDKWLTTFLKGFPTFTRTLHTHSF
jgi:hypothetical protein